MKLRHHIRLSALAAGCATSNAYTPARAAVDTTSAQNNNTKLTIATQYDYIVIESQSITVKPN